MYNAAYTLGRRLSTANRPVDETSYTYVPHGLTGINASQNHKRVRGHYISGGPWFMRKVETIRTFEYGTLQSYSHNTLYRGGHTVAHLSSPVLLPNWGTSSGDLKFQQDLGARGAEAWNRLRPDLPDFSILSSMYELKDLPGMFKQAVRVVRDRTRAASKRSSMSHTGEYYLSIQFGWIPLYRDIRNFVKAHRAIQKRISQLIRDEGKSVRRSVRLKDEPYAESVTTRRDQKTPYNVDMSPLQVTQTYSGGKASTVTRHTYETRTWAVGSFRYVLPPGPRNVDWNRKMYRRIMGGRLAPSQIYAVIPWSWLVDYFTDLGRFIDAISPGVADRLIADYAYLMRTVSAKTETTGTLYAKVGRTKVGNSYVYETRSFSASTVTTRVLKARVVASPFGWGIKQSSLNTRQLAILGALGLSRLP